MKANGQMPKNCLSFLVFNFMLANFDLHLRMSKPKNGLGRVFNFKLGCFVTHESTSYTLVRIELVSSLQLKCVQDLELARAPFYSGITQGAKANRVLANDTGIFANNCLVISANENGP